MLQQRRSRSFSLPLRLSISAADATAAIATVNVVAAAVAAAGGVVVDGAINSSFIPFWQRPTPTETAASQKKKKKRRSNNNKAKTQTQNVCNAVACKGQRQRSRAVAAAAAVVAAAATKVFAWRTCNGFRQPGCGGRATVFNICCTCRRRQSATVESLLHASSIPLSFSHSLCFSFILLACLYPATTQCALGYP